MAADLRKVFQAINRRGWEHVNFSRLLPASHMTKGVQRSVNANRFI